MCALLALIAIAAALPPQESGTQGPDVAALARQLRDPHESRREEAARELGRLGPAAREAVPALIASLDETPAVRLAAAGALGKIGPDARAAVNALSGLFEYDENPEVVGKALGQIGPASVPALRKALGHKRREVRAAALNGLADIGPDARAAAGDVIERLKEQDWYIRERATNALRRIGPPPPEFIPNLIQLFGGREYSVRSAAVEALAGMGETSFEPLRQALTSPDPQVRIDAVQALERNKKCLDKAVPLLIAATKDGERGVRAYAVAGLGRLGPAARPALPAIIEAFGDKDSEVSVIAGSALQAIDPNAQADALRHPSPAVRAYACTRSGDLGPEGVAYIPRLLELLKGDESAEVRYCAARSLERFGDRAKVIVPALVAALTDENSHVQAGACIALKRFGAAAVEAVPALVQLHNRNVSSYAGDPLRAIRHYPPARKDHPFAEEALMKIAPHALPGILKDLSAEDRAVRDRAVVTVAALGELAKDAVPALRRLAGDEDVNIRRHALNALANVGPAAKEALPELLAGLNEKDADLCCRAAWACRALGTEAASAVPQLLKLLKDPSESVRCHAVFALAAVADDPKVSVPALAEALSDGKNFHVIARQEAVKAIARHTDLAAGQVSHLIGALDAVDSSLVYSVIRLLGQIGPKAKEAVPALAKIAAIPNFPSLSNAAKDAIGRIEGVPPQTRPADETR